VHRVVGGTISSRVLDHEERMPVIPRINGATRLTQARIESVAPEPELLNNVDDRCRLDRNPRLVPPAR
jgi:hypothetical protein